MKQFWAFGDFAVFIQQGTQGQVAGLPQSFIFLYIRMKTNILENKSTQIYQISSIVNITFTQHFLITGHQYIISPFMTGCQLMTAEWVQGQ